MALIDDLAAVRNAGEAGFAAARDAETLETARVAFLGARNGQLTTLKEAFSIDDPDILTKTNFTPNLTAEQRDEWTAMWAQVKAAP